jgi:hypothetical protein
MPSATTSAHLRRPGDQLTRSDNRSAFTGTLTSFPQLARVLKDIVRDSSTGNRVAPIPMAPFQTLPAGKLRATSGPGRRPAVGSASPLAIQPAPSCSSVATSRSSVWVSCCALSCHSSTASRCNAAVVDQLWFLSRSGRRSDRGSVHCSMASASADSKPTPSATVSLKTTSLILPCY